MAMMATKLSSSMRAVADRPGVRFLGDHLGRGAGGDQRVEAGDGAAGDGDEAEREDLAGEDGPGAVDEAREGGKLQLGAHEEDADAEHAARRRA